VHAEFGKDILTGDWDVPENWIRNNAPWRRNSTSGFNFDTYLSTASLYVWSYKVSAKCRTDRWLYPLNHPLNRLRHFSLNEWSADTRSSGTVLQIANLMADSESGSPDSYSSILITIHLSRLDSEIFVCGRQTNRRTDRRTDNADDYYSWPPYCEGPANNHDWFSLFESLRRATIIHTLQSSHWRI